MVKIKIKRNLKEIKGNFRNVSIKVKEQLLLSFCRSLLIYFETQKLPTKLNRSYTEKSTCSQITSTERAS